MELEMMRVAVPHIGVEPCAGAKTDVIYCIEMRLWVFLILYRYEHEIVGVSDIVYKQLLTQVIDSKAV